MKRSYSALIVLLLLTLFLVAETIRLGYSSILYDQGSIDSFERALALDPLDAELNYHLARVGHLLMTWDENRIEDLYVRSIELAPSLSSSWLGLTEIFIERGEKKKAHLTLTHAVEIAPFYIAKQWEAAILALRVGFQSLALENLRVIARADPAKRDRVFDVCWRLIDEPGLILDRVVTDDALPDYLRFLIVRGKLEETFPVWHRMKKAGVVPQNIAVYYVEFLAATGHISMASSIWAEMFGKSEDDSLVWNGGFEDEPIGNGFGFDWKIHNIDGVRIDFDSSNRREGIYSLRLRFDGEHNVDFYHVSQIVPVEPDADYLLSSYVASRNLTTRSGIALEVSCYPKVNMIKATDSVTETTGWYSLELPFHTPLDCKSVIVKLRRYKSNKIDRYISGTAWVDDVKIIKAGISADAQG